MSRIGVLWLALAVLASAAGIDTAHAQDPTESAIWNLVKESKRPDDIKAYLEAYPNGAFAEMARARLRELEQASARPPAPGPSPGPGPQGKIPGSVGPSSTAPPTGGGPPLSTPSIVREVQERLYNLNYEISVLNGQVTDETRKAIRDWQNNTKRPVTGDLTHDELASLRGARVPTTWGALAYAARGASAVVWNRPSRQEAVSAAMSDCRAKGGGNNCKVLTAAENGCGALGFYTGRVRGTTHWGAYAIVRPTLAQATDQALSECRRQAKQPEACGVRLTFCADGSHKR